MNEKQAVLEEQDQILESNEKETEVEKEVTANNSSTSISSIDDIVARITQLELRVEELEIQQMYRESESALTILGEQYVLSEDAFNIAYNALYEASLYQMRQFPPQTDEDQAYYQTKIIDLVNFIRAVLGFEEEHPVIIKIPEVFEKWMNHYGEDIPAFPPPLNNEWFSEELLENVSYSDDDYDFEDEEDEV